MSNPNTSVELRSLASANSSPSNENPLTKKELGSATTKVATVETVGVGSVEQPSKVNIFFTSIIDSFKEKEEVEEIDIDPESLETPHKQELSKRHVLAVTLAGGLGTGLLVGIGKSLTFGGAGGLFCGFGAVCFMLVFTMMAAGVLAVAYSSLPGGFNAYAAKLIDPSLGFAVAWNYALNWLTVLPLEMVTASMTIKYWNSSINPDIFITIFFPLVVVINLFGARGYAEAEFYLNILKVLMIVGFIILGLLIDTNVVGNSGYIGLKNLQDVSMFPNGFKGVCSVFVTAAFSFGGTEFMALTAADQRNPRKAMPSAIKHVCYRMVFVYFLSIFIVSLLVASNSPQLMGSADNNGAPVSPYVIAIAASGVRVVPHIINAVILAAVLSVGNAALYSSSRTIYSLAQQGFAPQWFYYLDKQNRPIRAMLVSIIFGFFSFIAAYENQENIFTWLLSLSGLAIIFTWSSICLSHIRFLRALKKQGVSINTLGYRSGTIWTSSIALAMNVLILCAQFWVSLFPFNNGGKASALSFFQNYTGIISFLCFYIGHKVYLFFKDRQRLVFPFIRSEEIDLETDRKIFDVETMRLEEEEDAIRLKNGPLYKRVVRFFC